MSAARILLLLWLALAALPAGAVEPDEVLTDPKLEARARELSKEIRCLVCQNESIDDSNADLARDLRLLVRERLVEGDSDGEVLDYLVDRYGEFVLLRPVFSWNNALLWLTGPILFVIGAFASIAYIRGRKASPEPRAPLSDEERAELDQILKD